MRHEPPDFHAHLDVCGQCRHHPFSMCREGQRLLVEGGHATAPIPILAPRASVTDETRARVRDDVARALAQRPPERPPYTGPERRQPARWTAEDILKREG